jgi:hypothetical protein
MQIDVNGTRLWFDVDGQVLVPDGAEMVERPTLVLVHGGPGVWDHSYCHVQCRLGRPAPRSCHVPSQTVVN